MSEDVLYDGSGNQVAQPGSDSGSGSAGDPIGVVMTSTGTVTVERADGTVEQLTAGDPVYEDDILTTGDDSTVGIRFQDDSRFSLGEEGRMELDTFVYDAGAGTGSSLIDVAQGSFAFVSGMIAKTGDDAMSVQTPVATIGVRGTTVAGDVAPDGQTEVTLLPDTDGTLGEIAVFNQAGLQIMFDAFQRLDVGGSDIAPTAPRTIDPSELRPDIADTVRAIGADPSGGTSGPDEDGGGSDGQAADSVEDAAAQEARGEDPDISEEIKTAVETETLPGEDVAELTEVDLEQAAEEVAEIEVSAGGDRAVVQMADGSRIEVDMADLAAGNVVTPNGTVVEFDSSIAGSSRAYNRALPPEEDENEDIAGVRDAPHTFQNEILAAGSGTAASGTLGDGNQVSLDFSPDALLALQNAGDEETPPPGTGDAGDYGDHGPAADGDGPTPAGDGADSTGPAPDPADEPGSMFGRPGTEGIPAEPDAPQESGPESETGQQLGIIPSEPPPLSAHPVDPEITLGVEPILESDVEPILTSPPPVPAPTDNTEFVLDGVLEGPVGASPVEPPLPSPPPLPDPVPEGGSAYPAQNPIGSVTAPVAEIVPPSVEPVLDTTGDLLNSVTEPVQDVVNNVTDPAEEIVEDTTAPIQEIVEEVTDPVENVVEDLTDPAEEIVEDTTAPIQEIVEEVTAPVEDVVEDLTDPAEEIVADATAPVQEIVEEVTAPVENVVEDLTDPVDELVDGFYEVLTGGRAGEGGPSGSGSDSAEGNSGGDLIFDLSAPLLIPIGAEEEPPAEDEPEPAFSGAPPEDSAADSPVTVENELDFGDDPEDGLDDVIELVEDTVGGLAGGGSGDEGGEDGDGDSSLMDGLNLGETLDDTQNLLDNFLHPEDPEGEDETPSNPPPDDSQNSGGGLIGGVFSGLFGGNDDPQDEGNSLF